MGTNSQIMMAQKFASNLEMLTKSVPFDIETL